MKTALLTTLGLLVFAGAASAQVTADATATAGLTVVSGISISDAADIDFGNITQGQGTVTMNNLGVLSSTSGVTSSNGTVGKFEVTGFPTAHFSISVSAAALTGPGDPITFVPRVWGNGVDNAAGAGPDVTTGILQNDGGTGKYFIYLGGAVTVPGDQVTGAYEGDVDVTVTYTSI